MTATALAVEDVVAGWQERIRAAARERTPLRVRGGGSKDFYGQSLAGELLDTRAHTGIVDYEPAELVLTARAGTPLADIERTLEAAGQMLAFEPPHFGERATLGGVVASGLSGPRRPYAGSVRDLVLGTRIVDGRGDALQFGGRVMKNVAGFDVSRLMAGALGTLGVIAEVSLKCLPRPREEVTRVLAVSADQAIRLTNEWGGQPLPLSATAYVDGQLWVRLSGAAPAVQAAIERIGGDGVDNGALWWSSLREQQHPFFERARAGESVLWRVSVRATTAYADLGGEQLIEWGGALRWVVLDSVQEASRIRDWAAAHGGHATLFRSADKTVPTFQPLAGPVATMHARLKAEFDPHGILNPGRMYAAW